MPLPIVLAGVLAALLAGCKLVDQSTFAPEPDLPAATDISRAALPDRRTPLVTIRYDTANPAYEAPLEQAVRAAEARRPNLEYDVVSIVPLKGEPSAQAGLAAQGRDDAATVMRSIMDTGVPATRVRLSARLDPQAAGREVRVYIR